MSGTVSGASLRGLRTRIALTYEHLGLRTLLWRAVSFPLRFTPLRLPLGLGAPLEQQHHDARRWVARHGAPVTTVRAGERLPASPGHDLLVLGQGVEPDPGCVAVLQHAAHAGPVAAIACATVVVPDGTIASAGRTRDVDDPNATIPRFAGRPEHYGPATVPGPVLTPDPACALIPNLKGSDPFCTCEVHEGTVPFCTCGVQELGLRAWEGGGSVVHAPAAVARLRAGAASGVEAPPAELGRRLDGRAVRTADGRLRVIYVTQETTVGGGHRDIFEHLDRLSARGHDAALYSLGGRPDWFDLRAEVRTFPDWDALVRALDAVEAIKVATWWRSALPVWRATRRAGLPVYFVQDVETSYYPDHPHLRDQVLASYRNEFRYMTISGYNREGLAELGLAAELVPPGIDLDTFRPLEGARRRDDMLLALGRRHHLKNLDLTLDAWKALPAQRPELCLFGIDPTLGPEHGARYVTAPSDAGVNALFNEATIFLQTSRHEGFALPPLEAMAAGAAVICTDAHGNRDFCRDGENCLMPDADVGSVRAAIERLLADPALRRRLGEEGTRTAADYAWERRIDTLEAFLERVAS